MIESAGRGASPPAEQLRAAAARLRERRAGAIPSLGRATGTFPLSFAQERLWFLDRLEPGSALYNVPGAACIRGPLLAPVLAASVAGLVARHASLRTTFDDEAGRPFQRVAAGAEVSVPLVDLGALPGPAREAELARLGAAEVRRPFELSRGPLVRVLLFRLGPAEHAVVYTIHHIVSDGWSSTIFLGELAALYDALSRARPSPLPPLPIQYADFAVWQRRRFQGEVVERHLDYWRRQLAGCQGLELPADRPRPAVETFRGAMRRVALGEDLAPRLQELARREGTSLFMVLLAAFAVLLHRYTGRTDVPVGSPIASRNQREVEGLIGFFANTLVLRSDLAGDPTFRALLDRVREMTLAAYAHQGLPFERVVEAVQPVRDMSRNPLFQVMCALQNQPRREVPAGDLSLVALPVDAGTAKFDFTLIWSVEGDRLWGLVEHNTDLFDGATVLRISRHCEALLAAAAADPDGRIADLPLLGEAERQAALVEWNDTAAPPPGLPLTGWIAEHAARRPDAVALAAESEVLTYRGLELATGRLARRLRDLGVDRGSRVALCLDRSPSLVVGLLAVLRAGGAFLPLDPAYPEERLAWLVRDAGARLLLTERRLAPLLAPHVERVLCLDVDDLQELEGAPTSPAGEAAAAPPSGPEPGRGAGRPRAGVGAIGGVVGAATDDPDGDRPTHDPEPGDPAYLIYTSGSTGEPKGVLVPHGGLANLAAAYGRACGIGPADRFLQFSSPSFDASVVEVALPLAAGAALCLAPREALLPGPGLLRLLAERQVTAVTLPPSVLAVLPAAELPALAIVLAGGEACPAGLAARWGRGRRFVDAYGPTEATVCATVAPGETGARKPPIGRPLANVEAYVLDPGLRPVPAGVPGELCLGGAGLAIGYWGRPALSAEKFVPHPWAGLGARAADPGGASGARQLDLGSAPGSRLYRTGDLVRRLAGGEIDFLGRIDHQVKVRGFRIEPGEIEAALLAHPAVRQAAVVARPFRPGDLRLVAYVVLTAGRPALDLRDFLRTRLPEHMVPALFTAMPALPLAPSGKVDRAALAHLGTPAGGEPAAGEAREIVPPRTPVEEVLAGIWAEVLGRDRIGADDDFFALSGNSLLATQVAHRVHEAFGVELPLRRLFERTTLAELAREIQSAAGSGAAASPPPPPLGPAPRDRPPPASFSQEWAWYLQGGPVSAALNIPSAMRLSGRLDLRALVRALHEVARRHEALCTHYRMEGGRLLQVIDPMDRPSPALVDLAALPGELRFPLARALAAEEAEAPFDITRGPLTRVRLLRLDPEEHVLLLTVHHSLSDGWSFEMLQGEIGVLYGAYAAGLPSPLPDPPLQYADFSWWQRETLRGEALAAQVDYWRRRLAGRPPVLELPVGRPRPAAPTLKARSERLVLMAEAAGQLRQAAREAGCTVSMALLAAVLALLHRYTGEVDILLSTLFSGRNRPELAGIMGLFLNTVTLRTDLAGRPSFRELMQRVRDGVLEAYRYQDLPFPLLVSELFPGVAPSRTLLSRVTFNMLSFSEGPARSLAAMPGLDVLPFSGREAQAKSDLSFTCREGLDLEVQLTGSADLFDQPCLCAIAEDFAFLLAQASAAPETPLDRLLPAPHHRLPEVA